MNVNHCQILQQLKCILFCIDIPPLRATVDAEKGLLAMPLEKLCKVRIISSIQNQYKMILIKRVQDWVKLFYMNSISITLTL